MKGIVLNEFLEFAEHEAGSAGLQALVASSASGGRYETGVRYDYTELIRLAETHAQQQSRTPAEVVRRFGRFLFGRFAALYPLFLADAENTVALLTGIDSYIHGELQQLYPDGEFPTFDCRVLAPGQLEMVYESDRPFADLAEGLIRGCADHFGEQVEISREDAATAGRYGVRFVVSTTPR